MAAATRNNVPGANSRPQTSNSYLPFTNAHARPTSVFSNSHYRRLDSAIFEPTPPTTSIANPPRTPVSFIPPPKALHTAQRNQTTYKNAPPNNNMREQRNRFQQRPTYSRPYYGPYPSLPQTAASYMQKQAPYPPVPPSAHYRPQNPYPAAPPTAFYQQQSQRYPPLPHTAFSQNQQYPVAPPTAFTSPPPHVPPNNNWWPQRQNTAGFQDSPFSDHKKLTQNTFQPQPFPDNFGPPPPTAPNFNNGGTEATAPEDYNPYLPLPGFVNSPYPPYLSPTSFNNCSFHYSQPSNPLWTSDRPLQKNYKLNRSAGDDQLAPIPRTTKEALRFGKMKFDNTQPPLTRGPRCKKYSDCNRFERGKGDAVERMSRRDTFLATKPNRTINKTTNVLNIQCDLKLSDNGVLQERVMSQKKQLSPPFNHKHKKRTKDMHAQTNELPSIRVKTCSKSIGTTVTTRTDVGTDYKDSEDRINLLKLIAEEEFKLREWKHDRQLRQRGGDERGENNLNEDRSVSFGRMNAGSITTQVEKRTSAEARLAEKVSNVSTLSEDDDDNVDSVIIAKGSNTDMKEIFALKETPRSSCSSIENGTIVRRFTNIDVRSRDQLTRLGRRATSLGAVINRRRRSSRHSRRRARSQYDASSKARRRIAQLLLLNETEDGKEFCVMPVICIRRNCSPCCRPCCSPCCDPCRPCTPTRVTIWQTFPYQCTPSCCTTGCGPCCSSSCCPPPCCPQPCCCPPSCCPPPCCPPPCCPPPCCPPPCCPSPCCPPPCCPSPCCPPPCCPSRSCSPCCQPCCPSPCCSPCCRPCPPPCPPRPCCCCPPPPPCPPPNRPCCCTPPPCPPRCCQPRCRSCSPCGSCCQDSCSPCTSCCRTTRSCSPCPLCPPCYKPCRPCRPLPCPPCWRPCQPCCNPCCPPQPPCCPPRPCCKPRCCVPCNPCCRPRCPTPCCDPCCKPCCDPCCCQPCSPPCPPPCCPDPCCCTKPCCPKPCCPKFCSRPSCCPPPCCPDPCCPDPCCPDPCCPPPCCQNPCCPPPCCQNPCCPPPCCQNPCCPPPCCRKPRCCSPCRKPRCCMPCCSPPPCCAPPCCPPSNSCCPKRRCCPRPCPPPCFCVSRPCSPGYQGFQSSQPNNNCCSKCCSPCCPPPPRPPPCIPRRSMGCRPSGCDGGGGGGGGCCCPCPVPCPPCTSPMPIKRCCRRRRKRRCCCCCCPDPPLPQTAIVKYCPCPAGCICPTSCPCPCMPTSGCCC